MINLENAIFTWIYLLDHGLCKDLDFALLEGRFGVVDELLAEHGQDGRKGLNEGDADPSGEFGIPRLQIILQKIVEFTTEE